MAEKATKSPRRRVLLFPFPFHGHINPMLELAAVLHWRCFSITVFQTDYNNDAVDPAKYPSYRFVRIPDEICKQRSSSHQDHVLSLIRELNDNCMMPFGECLGQVLSEKADVDGEALAVACLVLDMHWYRINQVAEQLGVPTLVLRTGSAASLNGFIALPALYTKGILPAQAEWELEEAVEDLTPLRVRDMIAVGNNREDLMHFVELDVENARSSRGIILNTSHAMEAAELEKLQRDLSLPAFAVGPLHKFSTSLTTRPASSNNNEEEDRNDELLQWLDSQPPKSVLYVSFGSLACMDRKDLTEMAWGLANSGQPFLWVLRPGSVEGPVEHDPVNYYLPEGFKEATGSRGRIVEWARQRQVLGHTAVGGFWTHAGWNSMVEAMAEGVPMICTPFFADQMGNTRYAAEVWGVGEELRRPLERGSVESAVRRLLLSRVDGDGDGDGWRQRRAAKEMQQTLARSVQSDVGSSHRALDRLVCFLHALPS